MSSTGDQAQTTESTLYVQISLFQDPLRVCTCQWTLEAESRVSHGSQERHPRLLDGDWMIYAFLPLADPAGPRVSKGVILSEPETNLSLVRNRVDLLENNYAEILSLLSRNSDWSTSGHNETPRSSSSAYPPSQRRGSSVEEVTAGALDTARMSLDEAETLVDYFREMSQTYPFVIVPEDCDVALLRKTRPMLFQAVITAASWRNSSRQSVLHAQFLKEVSVRLLVKPERSLDLLQAVLVYFGWLHLCTIPCPSMMYRVASLAVTMAIELGLNRRPVNATQHELILNPNSGMTHSSEMSQSKLRSHEAYRAYLGASALSASCLVMFRKPPTLEYSQYLEDCATSLAADGQYSSDTFLVHHLRATRIAAEISSTFDHGSKERMQELSDDKVRLLVQTMTRQLEDWRSTVPPRAHDKALLDRYYYMGRAYIHEVGLFGLLQGQTPSMTRISLLFECFTSVQSYLSQVMELSIEEMAKLPSLEWRALNLSIMLGTKSSLILDSPCNTPDSAARVDWLCDCLDTLCLRTTALYQMTGAAPDQDHYFRRASTDWSNVKKYYQAGVQAQRAASGLLASQVQQTSATYPNLDTLNDLSWAGLDNFENWSDSSFQL